MYVSQTSYLFRFSSTSETAEKMRCFVLAQEKWDVSRWPEFLVDRSDSVPQLVSFLIRNESLATKHLFLSLKIDGARSTGFG